MRGLEIDMGGRRDGGKNLDISIEECATRCMQSDACQYINYDTAPKNAGNPSVIAAKYQSLTKSRGDTWALRPTE